MNHYITLWDEMLVQKSKVTTQSTFNKTLLDKGISQITDTITLVPVPLGDTITTVTHQIHSQRKHKLGINIHQHKQSWLPIHHSHLLPSSIYVKVFQECFWTYLNTSKILEVICLVWHTNYYTVSSLSWVWVHKVTAISTYSKTQYITSQHSPKQPASIQASLLGKTYTHSKFVPWNNKFPA